MFGAGDNDTTTAWLCEHQHRTILYMHTLDGGGLRPHVCICVCCVRRPPIATARQRQTRHALNVTRRSCTRSLDNHHSSRVLTKSLWAYGVWFGWPKIYIVGDIRNAVCQTVIARVVSRFEWFIKLGLRSLASWRLRVSYNSGNAFIRCEKF